jgi:hypothetical protein
VSWGEVAREGRWTEWTGLPSPLPVSALHDELEPGTGPRSSTLLGRRRRDVVTTPTGRYWQNGNDVELVELIDPPHDRPVDELLDALGPPEREGAGRHLRIGATTTEYVYPARGLALTVGRSYDQPPSFEPYLAQALLFAPTDLRTFVLERGGDDRPGPRTLP